MNILGHSKKNHLKSVSVFFSSAYHWILSDHCYIKNLLHPMIGFGRMCILVHYWQYSVVWIIDRIKSAIPCKFFHWIRNHIFNSFWLVLGMLGKTKFFRYLKRISFRQVHWVLMKESSEYQNMYHIRENIILLNICSMRWVKNKILLAIHYVEQTFRININYCSIFTWL